MMTSLFRCGVLWVSLLASAAWAQSPQSPQVDPWESFNRKMFGFNESLDQAVIRPVAVAYQDHAPVLVQKGVSNFFGNLRDLWSAVNSALQAKPVHTLENVGRFLINTTIGIYGLFDVATHLGIERHPEDFGQTLGRWGVPSGPYLVLPLIGPTNLFSGGLLGALLAAEWYALSLVSTALAAGDAMENAVELANRAAGIVVGKIGTAVATNSEVLEGLYARDLLAADDKVVDEVVFGPEHVAVPDLA